MPDLGGDCMAGFKADITNPDDPAVLIADIQAYLLKAFPPQTQLGDITSPLTRPETLTSLQAFADALDKILSDTSKMSGSTKQLLARERSKTKALLQASKFLQEVGPTTKDIIPKQSDIDDLLQKFNNPKFFGKAYPIDTYKIASVLPGEIQGNINVIKAKHELVVHSGIDPADFNELLGYVKQSSGLDIQPDQLSPDEAFKAALKYDDYFDGKITQGQYTDYVKGLLGAPSTTTIQGVSVSYADLQKAINSLESMHPNKVKAALASTPLKDIDYKAYNKKYGLSGANATQQSLLTELKAAQAKLNPDPVKAPASQPVPAPAPHTASPPPPVAPPPPAPSPAVKVGPLQKLTTVDEHIAMAKQLWEMQLPDGFYTKIADSTKYGKLPNLQIQGNIFDKDGKLVGSFTRILHSDKGTVEHTVIAIPSQYQGKGLISAFNAQAEANYLAHGYTSITLHADASVGGYAWAKAGYQMVGDSKKLLLEKLTKDQAAGKVSVQNYHKFKAFIDASDIGGLAQADGGKDFLLGSSWYGKKNLLAPKPGAAPLAEATPLSPATIKIGHIEMGQAELLDLINQIGNGSAIGVFQDHGLKGTDFTKVATSMGIPVTQTSYKEILQAMVDKLGQPSAPPPPAKPQPLPKDYSAPVALIGGTHPITGDQLKAAHDYIIAQGIKATASASQQVKLAEIFKVNSLMEIWNTFPETKGSADWLEIAKIFADKAETAPVQHPAPATQAPPTIAIVTINGKNYDVESLLADLQGAHSTLAQLPVGEQLNELKKTLSHHSIYYSDFLEWADPGSQAQTWVEVSQKGISKLESISAPPPPQPKAAQALPVDIGGKKFTSAQLLDIVQKLEDPLNTGSTLSTLKQHDLGFAMIADTAEKTIGQAASDAIFDATTTSKEGYAGLLKAIAAHISGPAPHPTAQQSVQPTQAPLTFAKAANQPLKQGTHPVFLMDASDGSQWVFKPTNEPFRADTEDAAHKIAHLFGYQTPDSAVVDLTVDGKKYHGHIQKFYANQGSLKGIDPATLSRSQLTDVLREHLLDWALDNDDSHNENFLRIGENVVGLDKGRAFKHYGANLLIRGRLSSNAHVYYEDVYNAIVAGKIKKEDVDNAYKAVIQRARQMQRTDDQALTDLLNYAFQQRPSFPSGGKTGLIKSVIERKSMLEADFQKFYGDLYKAAGWQLPEIPKPTVDGAHTSFSPEVMDAAVRARSRGVAVFFDTTALEDSHMLLWTEKHGADLVNRGEAKIRAAADQQLVAWLKGQGITVAGPTPAPQVEKVLPSGFVQGADLIHQAQLGGAKTISHHADDKAYNATKIAEYEAARTKLAVLENAISSLSPDEKVEAQKLVDHYKAQFAIIDQVKASGSKTTLGQIFPYDIPNKAPVKTGPPPVVKQTLQVTAKQATIKTGTIDPNTGEFVASGSARGDGQTGTAYHIEIGDLEIEYRPWSAGAAKSQQGILRFTSPRDISPDQVIETLRSAGLSINEASETSMENFYWRHLQGISTQRTQSPQISPPIGLSPEQEVLYWRKAWGDVLGQARVDNFVKDRGYAPKFLRTSPFADADDHQGRPYWERLDWNDRALINQQFPVHRLGNANAAAPIVRTGGLYATEERTRLLGQWLTDGMSSSSDQPTGGASFLFTRLNQESNGAQVLLSPKVLKRTSNYAFNADSYGNLDKRLGGTSNGKHVEAAWDQQRATSWKASDNETMIKHGVSVLDDIEVLVFPSESQRQAAIQYLADMGITELRGMPVNERFVTNSERSTAVAKAHRVLEAEYKRLGHFP